MKGEAGHWLEANPDIKSENVYDKFKKSALDRFEPVEVLSHAISNLMATMQKPTETVDEFATRIRLAGRKAVRTSTDPAETKIRQDVLGENLLAQFLRGLKKSIRRQVLSRSPKTFAEAITTRSKI